MEKYSRYVDNNNRLYILLARYHTYKDEKFIPTSVLVLDVKAEKDYEYTHEEFLSKIESQKIKQLK